MTIEIRVPEIDQLQRDIKRATTKGTQEAAKVATRKMVLQFKRNLKAGAPEDSGNLKRHIKHSVRKARKFRGYLGKVGLLRKRKDKDWPFYAFFLERGAKQHTIKTRGGGLSIGDSVFKSVEHPGIEADYLFRDTFNENKGKAAKIGSTTFIAQLRKYIR